MKPTLLLLISFLLCTPMYSQIEFNTATSMNWTRNWTNFDPDKTSYPTHDQLIPNFIDTDLVLSSDIVYLMSGHVYVTNGAVLTIEPGTLIRCQTETPTSLVVTKGAKLIAEGNKGYPIVFTSNKSESSRRPGDWGGIIIMGGANVNTPAKVGFIEGDYEPRFSLYGGENYEEETTRLAYLRIEFAGKNNSKGKAINGLSLYALGATSVVKNIMVSYSANDAFEFYGGVVNPSHLISYKTKDDDFDFNLGYIGELSHIMAIRHPFISDTSGSHAVEIDGFDTKKGMISDKYLTAVTVKNATLINLSDHTNYQHTTAAISSNNLAKLKFINSKISGFANVAKFDTSYQSYSEIKNAFTMTTSLCNIHDKHIILKHKGINENQAGSSMILKNNMFTTSFTNVGDLFERPLDQKNPKFTLKEIKGSYAMMQ